MKNNGSGNGAKDRHILLAVDESKSAQRALLYVADFLGGQTGFRATILRIIPEQSEDYFETETDRQAWLDEQRARAGEMLDNYRKILVQSGFEEEKVAVRIISEYCRSIAECILEQQKKLGCCTVVVGRRVISRKEEFLFGSTSARMLHTAKSCALWIIE
ncbi:MAG: universal stress protein [Nitrospirae bacterium]|nr:universal stress protein [Nitrospirota bacterium]